MKNIILIVLITGLIHNICLGSYNLHQDSTYAVVLLNNGATIRGNITEHVESKFIRIVMSNGAEFKIPYKKIYAITNEESYPEIKKEFNSLPKPKKIFTKPEIYSMAGVFVSKGEVFFTCSAVGLYHFGKNSLLGLGIIYDKNERNF